MKATLNGNTLTVVMELEKGTRSKSGKSLIVFSTGGFKKVENSDLQISINVIKPK
jgi:hypothetical protein